jgi:PAS domain S-box-containing protein
MHYRSDVSLVRRLDLFASFAAASCVVIGLSVLSGWALHVPGLVTWGATRVMVPNTAACFLLAGLSLWLLRKGADQPFWLARKLIAHAATAIFSLLSLTSLLNRLFHLNLSIDFLMFLQPPAAWGTQGPAFMSPITAVGFLLLGCALAMMDWLPKGKSWPTQFLCLGAAMTTLFGFFGLILGARVSPLDVAAPTVAAFLVLNFGILCSRPRWALGGLMTRRSPGAKWLRRALPGAALLFGLIGWLLSQPLLTDVHLTWIEVAVLALLTGCMLTLFIGWIAYMVDRSDDDGVRAEQPSNPPLGDLEEPEAEIRLQRWVRLGAGVAVLLTSLLGLLSWRMARQSQRDAAWVAHTHEASAALEITLRHLVDTETGARGFFLTGQAPFLQTYDEGQRAAILDLAGLRKLIRDPDQQRRLDLLGQRVAAKLQLARILVTARKNFGTIPTLAQLEQGKQLMDDVRVSADAIEAAEDQFVVQRSERARATRHLTTTAVGLGSIFEIIFLFIAGMTVSREIGVSAEARAQIKTLNADLERRVGQRTAELQSEVTVRIASEAKLKNQAALLELADDAILVRDLENRVVFFNPAAQVMYGLSPEEISGRVSHELLQTEFPLPLAAIDAALASNGGWQGELRHRTGQGVEMVVASRWTLQRDEQGAPMAVLEINRDITERKQNEEQLAAQAEELRQSQKALEDQAFMMQSILDSMIEGLVAADEHGKFVLWNPAAEKIMGLGATGLPPQEWSAHYGVFLPDKVTPVAPGQTALERAVRGEVVSTEVFLRNPALDREVWLEINSSPLRGNDGVLRGGVAAFRDITQRKADELEIRKLNEDLEARIVRRTAQLEMANRELEAFSYSVSHDLRSPLRHIAGFTRILINEFGGSMEAEARAHLQSIEKAVGLTGQLIEGLLNMATLGRQALRPRHTDLNPLVEEIISQLRPECEGREVEWRVAPLPALDCDPILIRQVLQNLLDNALKYSRGRRPAIIEVDSIQRPGEPAVIFVRDNGAGFDLKYAEKLFGVFQRFHSKKEFEGTGVGLATVLRILQKHGGTIWAESAVDQGATFYFAMQPVTAQTGLTAKATEDQEAVTTSRQT